MRNIFYLISASLLLLGCNLSLFAQETIVSAEIFGATPENSNLRISPSGDKVLMMKLSENKKLLVTKDLTNSISDPNVMPIEDYEYVWAEWVSDERIIAMIKSDVEWNDYPRLISINWRGENLVNVTTFEAGFWRTGERNYNILIDKLENDPDHILITYNYDIHRINVLDGTREKVHEAKIKSTNSYTTDYNGILRYIEGRYYGDGETYDHLYRKSETDEWAALFPKGQKIDENPMLFAGFSASTDIVYIYQYDENNRRSVYTYNVDEKAIVEKVLFLKEKNIWSISTNSKEELASYTYFDSYTKRFYLDEEGHRLDSIFKTNFPDSRVEVVDRALHANKYILKTSAPNDPGTYYWLDLVSNKIEMITYNYQKVDIEQLTEMKSVSYVSGDGLTIKGFLSLPRGSEAKNLPMVVYSKDLPYSATVWGFDHIVQFLTGQGYAVFEPNYRGSYGYGKAFADAGDNEWGDKVLDDINDGTKWLIEQGIADKEKICILGKQYGGYTALQSLLKEKGLYKCSIAYTPITNLKNYMNGTKSIINNFRKKDELSYYDVSPNNYIEDFVTPILVFSYGIRDGETKNFFRRMKSKDKDIILIDPVEDRPKKLDEVVFLKETAKFLAKHLKE